MAEHGKETRYQIVAEVLRPVLDEGDELLVRCEDGEVFVTEVDTDQRGDYLAFRREYPEVYGHLLGLNERIARTSSGSLLLLILLLGGAFCIGLHLEWWDDWMGKELAEKLRSGWTYALVMGAIFVLWGFINVRREAATYRRERAELHRVIQLAQLDRSTVLARIQGDEAVAQVASHLKRETGSDV